MVNNGNTQVQIPGTGGLSGSIVTAAVIQFLASAAVLIFWGLNLWGIAIERQRYPNHEVFKLEFWIFYIWLPVGFALLGLVSSIGLLRVREWARRCTVFLSIVPVSTYAVVLAVRPPSLFPGGTHGQGIYDIGDVPLLVVACAVGLMIPVSIWWLVLFTSTSMKARFQAARSRHPDRRD
jgi:hypothetical protein